MTTVHIRRYLAATEWLTGPVWAVKTPYDAEFIEALKSTIRGRHREWIRPARIWVVTESQKEQLKGLLREHFGTEAICSKCARGEPCWVWRSIDDEAAVAGLKGASCGDSDTPNQTESDATRSERRAREEQSKRERERAQERARAQSRAPGGGSWEDFWRDFARNSARDGSHDQSRRVPPAPRVSNVITLREAAELLGVDMNASVADVKKAYARAAMQHHPDRGGDTAKMVRVNQAKEAFEAAWKRNSAGVRA